MGQLASTRYPWVAWWFAGCLAIDASFAVRAGERAVEQPASREPLRVAFACNREHYYYPQIYIYDHDGVSAGVLRGPIHPEPKRLDHQPALSGDGRFLAFGSELEGQLGYVQVWDLDQNRAVPLPGLSDTPNAQMSPSLSARGTLLAFSAWRRPGTSRRWDVFVYDVAAQRLLDVPHLSTPTFDERRGVVSGDGRWVAFTTNDPGGRGLTDIRLLDRSTNEVDSLLELNSAATETQPALSGDGRYIAFLSGRDGGPRGNDVYLFDRVDRRMLELPGLNSPGQEQSPSLTSDGRYVAFVSERLEGAGERDVYLYDRQTACLLETPGLNTSRDEMDPSVALVSEKMH